MALASTLSLALRAASPAWAQTPPQASDGETVPVAHGNRVATPGVRLHWGMGSSQPRQPEGSLFATSTRVRHPISFVGVLGLAAVGTLSGLVGAVGGGILGAPFALTDSPVGFFGTMYLGYSLLSGVGVWWLGDTVGYDGNFVVTLLGAVGGAALGWSIQFWIFDPGEAPPVGSAMVITALLSTTGAVTGYALSAVIADAVTGRSRHQTRLVPAAHPLRDGLVLGLGGTF